MTRFGRVVLVLTLLVPTDCTCAPRSDAAFKVGPWAVVDALEAAIPFSREGVEATLHTTLQREAPVTVAETDVARIAVKAYTARGVGPQRWDVLYFEAVNPLDPADGGAVWLSSDALEVRRREVEQRYPGLVPVEAPPGGAAKRVREYRAERNWGALYFGFDTQRGDRLATVALRVLNRSAEKAETTPAAAGGPRCTYAPDRLAAFTGVVRAGVARTCEEIQRCFYEKEKRGGRRKVAVQLPAASVRLRSSPKRLAERECREISDRWNFTTNGEGYGCFVNAFVKDGETVKDLATGLVWTSRQTEDLDLDGVTRHLARLNQERFGAATGWRLPTLEEALSIVEDLHPQTRRAYHLSDYVPRIDTSLFAVEEGESGGARPIWTSDFEEGTEGGKPYRLRVTADYQFARCWGFGENRDVPLRAVRSMSPEEYQQARAAFSNAR